MLIGFHQLGISEKPKSYAGGFDEKILVFRSREVLPKSVAKLNHLLRLAAIKSSGSVFMIAFQCLANPPTVKQMVHSTICSGV